MKVGRVAIITRGRYAGKKVRHDRLHPFGEIVALEKDKEEELESTY